MPLNEKELEALKPHLNAENAAKLTAAVRRLMKRFVFMGLRDPRIYKLVGPSEMERANRILWREIVDAFRIWSFLVIHFSTFV